MDYQEQRFRAQDDLELYYRDYGDRGAETTPILCLAGLTRSAPDFHELALHLCPKRRVLCLDLRGRGQSAYDPDPKNYNPATYLSDIGHLLNVTACHRVIVIGTSLGGILTMALGAARPTALAGVILNDIGPEIDPTGVARIGGYAGETPAAMDLEQAAKHQKQLFSAAYPDWDEAQWRAEALRTFRQREDGMLVQNYDPAVADIATEQGDSPVDFWPYFKSLSHIPALAIRGALSDILSAETFARMAEEKPDLIQVSLPNRGHVPQLTEPACIAAIDDFLESHGQAKH
ncbi:MAG: alpha/beta hydrolase [Rhodospirillaceae bacterium]|jgi:pimeloyl-ACP methyl ester carboxylesterase|nr:alpha/beta hydrolase [Rhodospirillaceae bacterium]MBT3495383.1 alpha/beta hydrolase [Rhodospirillaceae bacterium]MBT3778780.1 alpha/beta hydrolase [Rhodospirillaceae bacterium]MBT3975574.1 alpha/beta hydrolase [Rhodospirillaceae bacterium]MBT4566117.1 alpha/beta hydrolase [Rhodospirillaceae bacterium]